MLRTASVWLVILESFGLASTQTQLLDVVASAMAIAPPDALLSNSLTKMSPKLPTSSSDSSSPSTTSSNQSVLWSSVMADSLLPHVTPSNQSSSSVSLVSPKISAILSSSSEINKTDN